MKISVNSFIVAICLSFTIFTHGFFTGQDLMRIRWSRGRLIPVNRLYSIVESSSGAKRRERPSKYTWETVGEMMKMLGLTLLSTKEEFENQTAIRSQREVKYHRNDDRTTIHKSRISQLQQRGGNKSQQDLMKSIEGRSAAMIKKNPKGRRVSQNKEKKAMRVVQSYFEEMGIGSKGTFVELVAQRTMNMAFTTAAEITRDTICRAIRANSAWVEDKTSPKIGFSISYGEIANSLDQGGSLVLVAIDADTEKMLKLWFVYDDSEGRVSKGLRALGKIKTDFQPVFAPTRKAFSKGVMFMSRFMYDPTVDSLKLAKAFDDWCATSEGRPLDFWNHDQSQINHPGFRKASASFRSLRDSLSTCTLPDTSNEIILPGGDVVRYRKKNLINDGRILIRIDGSPPSDRNDVDVFIFPILEEGGNKDDSSSWTKVCIASSREGIDLVTHNLRVVTKRKGEEIYMYELFDLATDQAAIVAELRRCKAIPHLPEEDIESEKKKAKKYDRELAKRRGTEADEDEDDDDDDEDIEAEETLVDIE